MQDVFNELNWRGLVNQTTDDENLQKWLNEKPRTVYAGFDPTADSLHVGHMMALIMLRKFQQAGHRPIAVIGGATGMIGDPSGRSDERNLLTVDEINSNIASIELQMRRFLDFDCGDNSAVLANNYDWTNGFSYLEFLRDIGKNFPVNVMLAKDSVKSRLNSDSGLSYTEFSYMLLQAYDFVHLNRAFDCELQLGGSDQWGNITAGIDLGRRMQSVQLYGITWPLLTKSDGQKMGKTASGAVWLAGERTSPYQFYQYWINLDDQDAYKCFRFFSDLPEDEVNALIEKAQHDPGRRIVHRQIAEELTLLAHGEDGLKTAQRATEIFFGAEISDLSDAQLTSIFADVPSSEQSRASLDSDGLGIIDALVAAGLSKTKGEARRTIQQGGAYVNNRRVEDGNESKAIETVLGPEQLASETVMVLRSGKKRYALLRFV